MKKFFVPLIAVVAVGLAGLFVARFLLGGNEDSWICTNGVWEEHGKPSTPKPTTGCGELKANIQTFNEAGLSLTFEAPTDTTFRKEIADDAGRIRVASFYVERGPRDNPTYQLYALYQPLETVTSKELDKIKTGMDPKSFKEVTIDGIKGIEGLVNISGPKAHFVTAIIKEGKLFTVSTYPPTVENMVLTDQILATFRFK
ncbi:hypothetical protein A2572_03315 [Candidatus Collierbacteria bacterium RIFOXYD1_FULL_40_9]|uniref:Uncharacterized protein n=1 Tax=Candidatus Collierbacteria bacterium RIFOXYD1_FULL_40_9 TaxID=1817731 RepID=A0A1F5FWZ3_9BACT|nr:MAG: hypothetical protein A2572_03315 [Candidatus Collierbacteria bacterium RIFOXYD1_FULL_40_9]